MGIWLDISALLMAFFLLLSHQHFWKELSDHSCLFHTSLSEQGQGQWSTALIPGCHPDSLCALGQVVKSTTTPPHHTTFNRAHFWASRMSPLCSHCLDQSGSMLWNFMQVTEKPGKHLIPILTFLCDHRMARDRPFQVRHEVGCSGLAWVRDEDPLLSFHSTWWKGAEAGAWVFQHAA